MNILSSNPKTKHHLTEKGIAQAKVVGEKLVNSEFLTKESKKVDVIYCSPFLRTKETAEIISKKLAKLTKKLLFSSEDFLPRLKNNECSIDAARITAF